MAEDVVSIRPAEPEDAARLLALVRALTQQSDTFTVDEGLGQLTEAREREQIEQITRTTTNIILVATLGEQLIGIATVQATADITAAEGEVGVAVLKAYWGQGLGTALVEELIRWAQDFSTLKRLILTVQCRNQRATQLYLHQGFQPQAPEPHPVLDLNGEQVPAVDMVLTVNAD